MSSKRDEDYEDGSDNDNNDSDDKDDDDDELFVTPQMAKRMKKKPPPPPPPQSRQQPSQTHKKSKNQSQPPKPKRKRNRPKIVETRETHNIPPYHRHPTFDTLHGTYNHRLPPTVEFDILGQRQWGVLPILQHLHVREIDQLVGWANHVEHNGEGPQGHHGGEQQSPAPQDDLNATSDQQQQPQQQTTNNAHPPKHLPNPLLGIQPCGPLPPSHLEFLHNTARNFVQKDIQKSKRKRDNSNDQLHLTLHQFNSSALVALGMVWEEAVTANLLPLAELHVRRCRQLEDQEEKMEATLAQEGKCLPSSYEAESFQQWTLPPEEAMRHVMTSLISEEDDMDRTSSGDDQNNDANGDDASDNAATTNTAAMEESTTSTNAPNNAASTDRDASATPCRRMLASACPATHSVWHAPTRKDADATAQFCQRQQLDPWFVHDNRDLFHWLLASTTPPPGTARPTKKEEENNDSATSGDENDEEDSTSGSSSSSKDDDDDTASDSLKTDAGETNDGESKDSSSATTGSNSTNHKRPSERTTAAGRNTRAKKTAASQNHDADDDDSSSDDIGDAADSDDTEALLKETRKLARRPGRNRGQR